MPTSLVSMAIFSWISSTIFNPIFAGLCIIAYLLGSLNGAIILCKIFGLPDPRTQGSQNPGATNVMRIGGKIPALMTFLFDALKATPFVLLGQYLGIHDEFLLSLIGLFAVLGHLFPVWYGFAGGKGVATTFGFLLVLYPQLFAVAGIIWLAVFTLTRISAIAGLTTFSLVTPIASYILAPAIFPITLILATLIIIRHKQNILQLLSKE